MEMSPLISKMLIFVVLMVIGYVCARTKFAGREFTRDASKMVINVFMSATIINSVLVADIRLDSRELVIVMLALCLAVRLLDNGGAELPPAEAGGAGGAV